MNKNQQILAKIGGGSLALLLSLGLGQQASAVTLVENLSEETVGVDSLLENSWQGGSFTTGSGSYNLNSVTLLLQENTLGNLFVRLYTDNSGVPGTLITSFNVPAIVADLNENTFNLNTPQALTANTTYWVVSGISSGAGNYAWGYTDSFNEIGLPGWTIGDGFVLSGDQGVNWEVVDLPSQFGVNGTENATNIPEPGSVVALLGLGGLGLASSLKKRK